MELASKGWTEGATKIADLSSMFYNRLALHQYRKESGFSRVGPGVYNFGRLQSGHPEPYQVWRDSETVVESVKSRGVLKIGFNSTVSANVSIETIFNRGAAMATLIDCLERSGYRVELDFGECVRPRDLSGVRSASRWQCVIRLKGASDPVEHDLLAFAFAHPALSRRIMFGTAEQEPVTVRVEFGFHSGKAYGVPAPLFVGDNRYDVTMEHAIGSDDRWLSAETSVKWIAEQLQAQGVQLDNEN
jgi:hypothetical protein